MFKSMLSKRHVPESTAPAEPTPGATYPPAQPQLDAQGKEIPSAHATATGISEGMDTTTRIDQLQTFKKTHQWDYNLDYDDIAAVNKVVDSGDTEKEANFEHALLEEDSPYFEVRASVRNYDEDVPANTIRAWVIGMILTTLISGMNMLFSLHTPSVILQVYVVQLLSYPVGVFCAMMLPNKQMNTFGVKWNLNPGPFNIKEHAIIVMMGNASYGQGAAYATDILLAQKVYYNSDFGWGFQMLLVLTTQCLGFGLAGLCRSLLVWPAAMIWPQCLANTSLMYALHNHKPGEESANGWKIGRYKYFLIVVTGSFIWCWFPQVIAQGLTAFNWIVWIAPNNLVVNQIFGNETGFGLIPITFDWNGVIGYVTSPLPYPLFTIVNTVIGVVVFFLIGGLGIKYTGAWYTDYLPISSTHAFDNTGARYNTTRILTPDKLLDVEAYRAYSPIFLATFFTICYGMSFATLSAIIVHTAIFHSQEIWVRFKTARNQDADVHLKMMKKYDDAPSWWFGSLFVVMLALSFVTVLVWPTFLEWWPMIIAMLIALAFLVPLGMIQGITNLQIGLNVLTEFMIGYMLPGRPIAMMCFKTYGYITMSQALGFVQDMKLGHYLKVPPKVTFWAQAVATVWSSIVQVLVYNWALSNIPDLCSSDQVNNYNCPNASVYGTASVLWGLIGPARIFGAGATYSALQYFWLMGAAFPVITYFAAKRWPSSPIRYLHWPIIFGGSGNIPPATVYNYLCWGVNYITSAGLDTGLYIGLFFVFFIVQYNNLTVPQWFMNPRADGNPNVTNAFNNLDSNGAAIKSTVAPGATFGPSHWE
ncbi:putative small oligopeptide opt family protein [Coleophoma crateriformis]|uniref:Putative small oligopeptide opt family protein n=1 Tax=Coleophoma crateriformis TaxID=565419 RepID=A0A3D8RNX5_9HELO|nr:putative small oligopeptide opt family protein [Coleophoma crateriformis]